MDEKKHSDKDLYYSSLKSSKFLGIDDIFVFDFFVNTILGKYLKDEETIIHLLEISYRRYLWHLKGVRKLKNRYARRADFFALVIPIYSATLTFFLTTDLFKTFLGQKANIVSSIFLSIMGFGLTIMTILNSSWKSYEKSLELSNILIELNNWMMNFNLGIINITEKKEASDNINEKEALINFIKEQDKEMTKIGKQILITINQTANKV